MQNYSSWACSQYLTEKDNMPLVPLRSHSCRQIIRTTIGGDRLRIKFSNRCGNGKLVLRKVHIARSALQGSSKIIPETDTQLTFDGEKSVTIPEGKEVFSDFVDFSFSPLTEIAITIYYGSVPERVTGHPGSRTNTFFGLLNKTRSIEFNHKNKTTHWYTIAELQVEKDEKTNVVVCFGDSITDGRGSIDDKQNRWPDNLATALQTNELTKNVAVINQGIGGTCMLKSGIERFNRDVLSQAGLSHIIIFYGVNDIIYLKASAEEIIKCYKHFIVQAHQKGIKIFAGTILPFGTFQEYKPEFEAVRKQVNDWIMETPASEGGFDAFFDFANAMKDPKNQKKSSSSK